MRKQNFEKLALAFQMGPHLNNLISSYSHGMKQKLALIAAFSHTPKLLILDEPFVGLDPEAFVILKEQMKELCASGNSVLFSSHILDVVEKVCNKVSVIKPVSYTHLDVYKRQFWRSRRIASVLKRRTPTTISPCPLFRWRLSVRSL